MNYLITTFDGLGDGITYYPFFKSICEKHLDSLFFITSNIFLDNYSLDKKFELPANVNIVNNSFRKFHKNHWEQIHTLIDENRIGTIINLRIIGKRYEPDYYEFKAKEYNKHLLFYDDEILNKSEVLGKNIKEILKSLFKKVFNEEIIINTAVLKSIFPPNNQRNYIVINPHSRGSFKLWEIEKWSEIIGSLVGRNKSIKILSGFNEEEVSYTQKVIDLLSKHIKTKIEIINQKNLISIFENIQNAFLLISVDSWPVHFADAIGVNSLGIYITTSPVMWGGITEKFHYVTSKHLSKCENFNPYFGMCMNNKQKCEKIYDDEDDISVSGVLEVINKIYEQED